MVSFEFYTELLLEISNDSGDEYKNNERITRALYSGIDVYNGMKKSWLTSCACARYLYKLLIMRYEPFSDCISNYVNTESFYRGCNYM